MNNKVVCRKRKKSDQCSVWQLNYISVSNWDTFYREWDHSLLLCMLLQYAAWKDAHCPMLVWGNIYRKSRKRHVRVSLFGTEFYLHYLLSTVRQWWCYDGHISMFLPNTIWTFWLVLSLIYGWYDIKLFIVNSEKQIWHWLST